MYTQLLFYDRLNGKGTFYGTDGKGSLVSIKGRLRGIQVGFRRGISLCRVNLGEGATLIYSFMINKMALPHWIPSIQEGNIPISTCTFLGFKIGI